MHDFDYAAPATLAEAIETLAQHNGSAKILAGGTDLIDHILTGRLTPDWVVDVKRIPELTELTVDSDGLQLGAATPCFDIYQHASVKQDYSALYDCTRIIGGIQIQNRASVGGNLCNSGPAADSTPALIALSAQCVIAGPNGERTVPVEEFCTAPGKNVLQPGELLVALTLPAPGPSSGSHYRRFIPRNEMDIAVVGVGASVRLEDDGETIAVARIGLGAVGPTPLFAEEASQGLVGKKADEAALGEAAASTTALASPIDDMRGTIEFRKHVTGVLTKRVLQAAIDRARESK